MNNRPSPLSAWHRIVETRDPGLLDALLAEDCVFRSPAVHTPQEGKTLTTAYLAAALVVLGPTLRYHHEWYDDATAVLEFTADLDGISVHGIDMMRWGQDGRLVEFTVMVRPFKGLTTLMEQMGAELTPRLIHGRLASDPWGVESLKTSSGSCPTARRRAAGQLGPTTDSVAYGCGTACLEGAWTGVHTKYSSREGHTLMAFILWIIAVILVISGIVTLIRGSVLFGILLIVVGLLVGPGGVSLFG